MSVRVINADCSLVDFMYDPGPVAIRLNVFPLSLPAMVRVTDANEDFVEKKLTELVLPEGVHLRSVGAERKGRRIPPL